MRRSLYDDMDAALKTKAESIADAIDVYWQAYLSQNGEGFLGGDPLDKANNSHFADLAQRWVDEKAKDPSFVNVIVRIFSAGGRQIASSKNIQGRSKLPQKISAFILNDNRRFDVVTIRLPEAQPVLLRTFTLPVIEKGIVTYAVQVSSPLKSVDSALSRLRAILFLMLPLTVLVTAAVGEFLARLALNPVDSMIRTIRQITAENLKMRVLIPDTKDEIKRLADTFNDMLARLDSAFTSQRQFMQDISHELKTPLTILRGELEVALHRIRSPREYESVLTSNLEEVNKIIRMVENLLVLVKFDNKEVNLEFLPFNVLNLARKVSGDIAVIAGQKNISIGISGDENVVVEADENQISRVILNLLDNAFKYTPEAGSVNVFVNKEGGFAKITVSDNGMGVSSFDLPHIFDRFYRADKSRSSSGFGLGLSISKSIVDAHGGKIVVGSKSGGGTSFFVFLPLKLQGGNL
jgi:heavy metal sensor kinase